MPGLSTEVYRVSRHDALISVYPKHIDSEQLEDKMKNAGFRLKDSAPVFSSMMASLSGQELNFVKKMLKKMSGIRASVVTRKLLNLLAQF